MCRIVASVSHLIHSMKVEVGTSKYFFCVSKTYLKFNYQLNGLILKIDLLTCSTI